MLRVTTIYASSAGSAAAYYTKYLADSPGEVPGMWAGRQAAALGLNGEVSGVDLLAVLEGRDPVSGTPLGHAFADRARMDGSVARAVAGFDATFSAPKSLSVLWALTQDDRLLAAHDAAVYAALAHLERFGATTRVRSRNGRLHPDANGLTMAAFRQTTSRADDPQLHTHVVVSAKVQTGDGRWLALDARYLKRYQRMLGGLYQSVLRNELTHQLGVVWSSIEHGQAELLGVPDGLCDSFSKRTVEVERAVVAKRAEFIDRQGREPNRWELAALKREAAADTRSSKTGNPVAELTTRWASEAQALGWTGPDLLAAAIDAGRDHPNTAPAVDVNEIVADLSTGGSTWNRADVISALCDIARPNPGVDGLQWASIVERVTDEVIGQCIELDPPNSTAPRRRSDGRSLWLEPTAPHITTGDIVREEELVLSWALDAQIDEPAPSTTVDARGLDVLQADAARSVAGRDRLVLVVGPAGTGKTTALRAAVDDLDRHDRTVFGVAPSAKAARVLERETGVASDTLAKLLHEWQRSDRPPAARYRLPAGATVLVDEAGMIATPALARLVRLAEAQHWRVVFVGDPHQLQPVGRGGLFHELCATGRTEELQQIHRFTNQWEAAASLRLRRGDQRGWDAYIKQGRVVPGTFEEHRTNAAHLWLGATGTGGTVSVVASTNDHVDALNRAIQSLRVHVADLDPTLCTRIGGGEWAMVGDHVVSRRNDRSITTTDGEPIRNRELWTVTRIAPDGSLTVTAQRGHGIALLPVDYTREHVRLGYAATEHGVQGDTTTIGIELISPATTRRGAYVGVTRGRDNNTVLVVTDSHDLDEARDILDRIITLDRADIPATTQRRELAATDRSPLRPTPRCEVPNWLPELRTTITEQLAAVEARCTEAQIELGLLRAQLTDAEHHLAVAQRRLDPYQPAIEQAATETKAAQERVWTTFNRSQHLKGRHGRSAERDHHAATLDLAAAKQHEIDVRALAAPTTDAVNSAARRLHEIHQAITSVNITLQWTAGAEQIQQHRALRAAVDDWARWATGTPVQPARLTGMLHILRSDVAACRPECNALASAVEQWAQTYRPDLAPIRPPAAERSMGIEL